MKALVANDGRIIKTNLGDDRPSSYEGLWVDQRIEPHPETEWPMIAVLGPEEAVIENGVPVSVTQRWSVRQRTNEEMRREWSAKDFDERVESLAPGAWDRLESAAESGQLPDEVRSRLRSAVRQASKAVTVISDEPDTLKFMGAAVAVGVLSSEQAAAILEGP